MSAATSAAAAIVAASHSTTPISFNGDHRLAAVNLFLALAFFSLALMMVGRFANRLWKDRAGDTLTSPTALWRIAWLCAAVATALRNGVEAAYIIGWSPEDPVLTARILLARRWVLPISLIFTTIWMGLLVLSWTAIEKQLRRRPIPVDSWARTNKLIRPALVVVLSLVMAVGVVWARG